MSRSAMHTGGRVLRLGALVVAGFLAAANQPAMAQTRAPVAIDLPAQSLRQSLLDLANRTGVNILVQDPLVAGRAAPALSGSLTADEAVARLLSGSGLQARRSGTNSIVVETTPVIATPADGDGALMMNELTVTARRFEERLEDVPGSVLLLSDEDIERSNITDLNSLVLRSPNVNAIETGAPTTSQLSIRGLSNQIGNAGSGPTNGVYVDEVIINPTGRNTGLDPSLFDLERVEVLYGPQGTTFGRGAIGGAINYVTKKPSAEFEASLEAELGSFPDGRLRGVVNGAVLEDDLLNARLSFFGQVSDGFIDTPNLSEEQGLDTSDFGARIALRSEPADRLTFDFSLAYERNNYVDGNQGTEEGIARDRLVYLPNEEGDFDVDRVLTSFRADYETDIGTLTSLTSFFRAEERGSGDVDISRFDAIVADFGSKTRSIAQEFRLSSEKFDVPVMGATSFILGTNFSFNRDETDALTTAGPDFRPPLVPSLPFPVEGTTVSEDTRSVTNFAVFGDVIFEPVDRLELGAGVRFNLDRVKLDDPADVSTGTVGLLFPPSFAFSDSDTFTGVSPKGSARYNWTEDLSTYVAISTGYRSGGFNAGATPELTTFDEERAINYEGGIRSSWLDGRFTVNATGFATFYEDLQVFANVPTVGLPITVIENAAKARSIGAEISLRVQPAEGLLLGLDYGLARTKFVEFEGSLVGDVTGERLPNAPVHTLSIIGDYAHPVLDDSADLFLRGEYSYTSDYFNGIADSLLEGESFGDRSIINLRTGLRAERYEVELFVENLLDVVYQTGESSGISASLFGQPRHGEVGPTRRFGVRARVLF
ncbi:MAG: TonB-dependent receptor [Pseudomonadota bacterium]